MEIIIHIDSKKIDSNLKLAMEEYIKRTSPYCKVTIKLYKNISKISFKSGSKLFNVVPGADSPSSEELAALITSLNLNGISCIEFLILCNSNVDTISCDEKPTDFNLSSFHISADLTAVVLTEQIYRAYTIMNNITYHK